MGKHKHKHKHSDSGSASDKKKKKKRHEERDERRHRVINETIGGYTNEDNPFGDARLTEKFVWGKREEKAPSEPVSRKKEKERVKGIVDEIRKVKERREERETETMQWEEEKLRVMRDREAMSYRDWERKEEEFHKKTNLLRSEIRIREGRPKPIDLLAKNLALDMNFDCDFEEPTVIFRNLSLAELEDLEKDITMYQENDQHTEFWQELMVVCQDELKRLRAAAAAGRGGNARMMDGGLNPVVADDVEKEFATKSFQELAIMEVQIEDTISSGAGVDVEYWDAALKKLRVYKAKARLREIHSAALVKRLGQLRSQQKKELEQRRVCARSPSPVRPLSPEPEPDDSASGDAAPVGEAPRAWSPQLMPDHDDPRVVDGEDDARQLERRRQEIAAQRGGPAAAAAVAQTAEDRLFNEVAGVAAEPDEQTFADEVKLNEVYLWQDKYRPRKPRYFNRVHTGYDWNKYNQVHFDHDNPPPKTIQGYKFNIFYPDLIDKTKTPTYTVVASKDGETATITFHAGPPYEDVAFTIVNRDWEHSHRHGFKCAFERGVLHLYVRFRRWRYRR